MFHPSQDVFLPIAILTIVFTAGTIIPIGITWLQQRTKIKAIEVLKSYAERGQDPPANVLDAVNRINWPFSQGAAPPPKPMRDQSRGEHLSHVAGSAVIAADAPAARDPMFRVQVIERRAEAGLRRRLWAGLGLAFGAVVLAALALAVAETLLEGADRFAAAGAIGAALIAALAAPYLGGQAALKALVARASLTLRTLPRLRLWW